MKLTDIIDRLGIYVGNDVDELFYDSEVESFDEIDGIFENLNDDGRVHEKVDGKVDIYYSDLLESLKNPDVAEGMEDCISEGLFDPSRDYDLYKHIQCAQYVVHERDVMDSLENLKSELEGNEDEIRGMLGENDEEGDKEA